MGGGGKRERKRDVRGREQAGALKNIKNRNGDWSAHSSDWVKSLYMFIYRNSSRAVRGGGLWGRGGQTNFSFAFRTRGFTKF